MTNVEDSQTALRDSQTTIRQGNNIRILTYITIAYLPLGFVTVSHHSRILSSGENTNNNPQALFSVDSDYVSFMNNTTNVTFAVLVVLFVLGTYALALSLESIIDSFSRLSAQREKLRERRRQSSEAGDLSLDENQASKGTWKKYFPNSISLRKRRRGSEDDDGTEKISFSA